MPLGKITKAQIQSGYNVLTEIETALKPQVVNKGQIMQLSSQFYTLIPHNFGRNVPPLIDSVPLLKAKMKQIETLLEVQIAQQLLREAAAAGIHPADAKYSKLSTKIEVLEEGSIDWQLASQYLTNTYDEKGSPYRLELVDCFSLQRDGEYDRFEKFAHLQPRVLLWHGSRLSNWVGIISQGLRIAPPEAPKTGYMFGKGVYFGDMVAKSADYCFTTPSSDTGLLLLSDVALGEIHKLTQPLYMEQAPSGFQSVHAQSKIIPDPAYTVSRDGSFVPVGTGIASGIEDAFLSHSEFVVYDVAQIRMKYLLRVRFHHK